MKNYFYNDRIAQRLQMLLDKELPAECARNISTGEFGILPEPDSLAEYLPAVLIRNTGVALKEVNGALGIMMTENNFEIVYLYPYTFTQLQDVPDQARKNLQLIANLLLCSRTLDSFSVAPDQEEAGGILLAGKVKNLRFDSRETKLFRREEVPAVVGVIEYTAEFRTYQS